MHVAAGIRAGDPAAAAIAEGGAPIEGSCSLDAKPWAPTPHAGKKAPMSLRGLCSQEPHVDGDARFAQAIEALARYQRVGVLEGSHHPTDPRANERLHARAGAPLMRARLEREIHGGACCISRAGLERADLGMGFSRLRVPALAENLSAAGDHAAHRRIRRSRVAALRR